MDRVQVENRKRKQVAEYFHVASCECHPRYVAKVKDDDCVNERSLKLANRQSFFINQVWEFDSEDSATPSEVMTIHVLLQGKKK